MPSRIQLLNDGPAQSTVRLVAVAEPSRMARKKLAASETTAMPTSQVRTSSGTKIGAVMGFRRPTGPINQRRNVVHVTLYALGHHPLARVGHVPWRLHGRGGA